MLDFEPEMFFLFSALRANSHDLIGEFLPELF